MKTQSVRAMRSDNEREVRNERPKAAEELWLKIVQDNRLEQGLAVRRTLYIIKNKLKRGNYSG